MTATLRYRGDKSNLIELAKNLDAFKKVPEKYTETTEIGGTLSLLSRVLIIYLIYKEVCYYREANLIYHFEPDIDMDDKVQMHVDITVAMPCPSLSGVDLMDETQQDVFAYGTLQREGAWWVLPEEERLQFERMQHMNIFLREEYHSVADILFKDIIKNNEVNIKPLKDAKSLPEEKYDACRLHGTLGINKGPLARVWLAAHWDKKITKAHVFETNIEKSVEGIMQPKVKLALRTSGHLLLGVVRIYSRKAKYLLADCNEAFVKIKMAFRPGMVDLPEGHREANVNAITLPEVFHDFDTALPELNDIDIEAQFAINQSRADEITMREDYGGSLSLSIHDDGFGDMGFEGDTPDLIRGPIDANIDDQLFGESGMADVTLVDEPKITLNDSDLANSRLDGDGFGDEFGQPELFEDDLFAEPPLDTSDNNLKAVIGAAQESDDDGMDHMDVRPPSVASSCENVLEAHEIEKEVDKEEGNEAISISKEEENPLDQSTLLQNEDESFALAPVDASAYKGVTKAKRKRKLIVDEVKNISGEEMKAQLANTSDIVTTLDLAPPTKRLTYWKETGGVEKLFSLPSRTIPARALFMNYHRHLHGRNAALEDFSILGPSDLLAIEHIQNENDANIINNKRGRKRKHELQQVQNIADITAQSLAAPEPVRELEQSAGQAQFSLPDNLIPPVESSLFDNMRSPSRMLSMNDINGLDNLTVLHDLPLTPGNIHHGLDASDDFNHGDATPAGLHHGDQTPHHSGIENIEALPNLPPDQVSSILQEAENMPIIMQQDLQTNKTQRTSDISSDWNDYDIPPPPPQPAEEQLENETDEQFEERVLNKRAAQLFYTVKTRLLKDDCLILSTLTVNNTRKQAAQKFYSLLVLKKFRALNIAQTQPYSDIEISRGPLFENPKL